MRILVFMKTWLNLTIDNRILNSAKAYAASKNTIMKRLFLIIVLS